jgi:hypothetical protein
LEKKFGQTKVLSVRQELKVCLTECQANFSAVSRSLALRGEKTYYFEGGIGRISPNILVKKNTVELRYLA